uniref:Monocarboxylate transporter 12 n=1 Tax=Timema monikensis TaxID=170555 RepID=A0A7R9HU24_9NEOP|nr:unnamed protein product [Timema monikensis]
MSRVSINKPVSRRIRKISKTDSEYSYSDAVTESVNLTTSQQDRESELDYDCISYCEFHDIPPPPDGGYGWVIVFASFMCNMVVDGIAYMFGVFLGEFVVAFSEAQGKVAWAGGLLSGIYLSVGPIASALTNKYGCRTVCIVGSILGCIAFIFSSLSPNINVLIITYGIMGGIGLGLIYLPSVVCVSYYFETKRSLATGIAVCGSGVGTFVFAPLATLLLDMFGWRGTIIILAGLILNCAVFGALMRPLKFPKFPKCKPLLQRMADEKRLQMERGSIGGSYFMVQLPDGTMEKRLKMPINIDPGVHSSLNLDQVVTGLSLTPVSTMITLPTICEVKVPEYSGSSAASSTEELKKQSSHIKKIKSDKQITKITCNYEEKCFNSMGKENEKYLKVKDIRLSEEHIIKEDKDLCLNEENKKNVFHNQSKIGRNSSQPAFTTHIQGLPKNDSVPFFDRIRKTSLSERHHPLLDGIKISHLNISSNSDITKTPHFPLPNSSFLKSKRFNKSDSVCPRMELGSESIMFSTSKSSIPLVKQDIVKPMQRKDIFYSRSVVNLPEFKSQKSLSSYRQSVVSLPRYVRDKADMVDIAKESDCGHCYESRESFKTTLIGMMDISLLRDPVFLLISISNLFGIMGLYIPFFFLVDAAIKDGIEPKAAAFLLSIIGITNTLGRVICGYVADFPWVNSVLLNNICLLITTISIASMPFCESYTSYIIMAIVFGIAISGYVSLTSIILVDLLGLNKLTSAFGLLLLFRGTAAIIGAPLAGAVYDATHSYSASFLMGGGFFLISTATSFMAPGIKHYVTAIPDILMPINDDDHFEEEKENDNSVIQDSNDTIAPPLDLTTKSQEIKEIESVL